MLNSEIFLAKEKEQRFKVGVLKASKALGLRKPPKVKIWNGACPYSSGNELAHAHPDSGLICISRGRLESMNFDEIEDIALHETTHMLHKGHDTRFSNAQDDAHQISWTQSITPKVSKRMLGKNNLGKFTKRRRLTSNLCVICWSYGKNVKIAKICEYCKNGFCEIHKEPFRRKDFELLKKRYGDKAPEIPMKIEGHRCVEYDEFMDGEEKRILDEALESLNRLKNIIHIPKSSKPIISVGRRKQHKITVQTKQKRFQIWKLVAIVIAILLGIYFYSNPDKLNIIVQTISNLSNNLLKLISSVLWTTTANTTTTTQITPPTTTVKTMKCCCMVSCDRGSDCGWLENCFSVYKECPSSYCVK